MECLFDVIDEAFVQGIGLVRTELVKLFDEFFLVLCQFHRGLNLYFYELVAFLITT